MRPRAAEWTAPVVLGAALMLAAAACSGGDSDPEVQFDVDLQAGQSWVASGSPVDDGVMCAEGARRYIEYRDPSGATLTIPEVQERIQEGMAAGEPSELIFVIEMSCADGSGTFTIVEDPREDVWHVIDGRGAYSDLFAEGSMTYEYVTAEMASDPTLDDPPPEGAPLALRLTGTLETRPTDASGAR